VKDQVWTKSEAFFVLPNAVFHVMKEIKFRNKMKTDPNMKVLRFTERAPKDQKINRIMEEVFIRLKAR
jgi:hypothetical protein